MQQATSKQKIAINAIFAKRNMMEDKKHIIRELTRGRTEHTSDLNFEEAKTLLASLMNTSTQTLGKNKMVGKIFAMAHEMGWITERQVIDPQGRMVTKKDYSHVYNWIKKYGYGKKDLKQYQYNEIPKLLTQFENGPYKDFLSKL